MADEFHLGGSQAPADDGEETLEELQTAHIKLSDLKPREGALVSLTPQQQSLLKSLESEPSTKDRFTLALRHANFISDEEMCDHINAYNEAVFLGMDTEFNIQMVEGLKGTNRKGGFKSNLIGSFLDSFSHQKYTSNTPREGRGSSNPRSPLS